MTERFGIRCCRAQSAGEAVVTSGSFLVDAETRLNPAAGSIYFGGSGGSKCGSSTVTTVRPSTPEDEDAKITAAAGQTARSDRKLVQAQRFCPISRTDNVSVRWGRRSKLMIEGQAVFPLLRGLQRSGDSTNPQEDAGQGGED